jgi:hypothetical protein
MVVAVVSVVAAAASATTSTMTEAIRRIIFEWRMKDQTNQKNRKHQR